MEKKETARSKTDLTRTGGENSSSEKMIPKVYPVIDNDLARDNVENDIPDAELEDL